MTQATCLQPSATTLQTTSITRTHFILTPVVAMNLKNLALQIQEVLETETTTYELMGDIEDDGAAWFFDIDDETCGFISCESNEEDIKVPTVSIALRIANISNASASDLESILEKNGSFFSGSLMLTTLDDTKLLLLQTKIHAESYNPGDFLAYINNLQYEASVLL